MTGEQTTARRLKVLYVEDDQLSGWVIARFMEKWGYTVLRASDKNEAVQLLTATKVDMAVLDHRLPDGLGIELLPLIRQTSPDANVIYLSADAGEQGVNPATEPNVLRVLTKPAVMEQLEAALAFAAGRAIEAGAGAIGETLDRIRIGRFFVRRAPVLLDEKFVAGLEAPGESWIAVDMSAVGEIATGSVEMLKQAVLSRRGSGGRMCFFGGSDAIRERMTSALAGDAEVYADGSWLEPEGRRVTSAAERMAVLDSVVENKR